MYRRLWGLLCVLCLHVSVAAAAPDFAAITNALERHRAGESELRVTIDEQAFHVLEGRRQALSAAELGRLETPVLSMGDRGPDVMHLQAALLRAQHFDGELDGEFGVRTRTAVVAFQKQQGITADGKAGPGTRKALGLPDEVEWKLTGEPIMTARGPRMRYEVHDTLDLEARTAGNDTSWMKIPFNEINEQPRSNWTPFIDWLVDRGLVSYERHTPWSRRDLDLTFATADPATPLRKDLLLLSAQAQRLLKVSQSHPPRMPQAREWVIFIHEPHWDLTGQLQLLPALHQLAHANPKLQLKFLVEGRRPEGACPNQQACDIPLAAVNQLFSTEPSVRRQQIYYLLRNYLIDGALAYRLLYDPVPAVAIDDQAALARTPRSSWNVEASAMILQQVAELLAQETPQSQQQSTGVNAANAQLQIISEQWQTMPDDAKAMLAQDKAVGAAFRNLAAATRRIDGLRYAQVAASLEKHAGDLDDESKITELALVRDVTMTRNIVNHYQSSDAHRIPVVFIGNAHTSGMIAALPPRYGYVVLEPRFSHPRADDEEIFQDALFDYPKVLAAANSALVKLPVAPPPSQFPAIRNLNSRIAAKVTSRPALDGAALDSPSTRAIREAIDRNPFFNLAHVEFAAAGGGGQVPPPLDRAFASFSPGRDRRGSDGKLLLLPGRSRAWDEPARTGWQKKDRLDYLEQVILIETSGDEGRLMPERTVAFFAHPSTHRRFISVYEPQLQTYYFLELDGEQDVLRALVDPVAETAAVRMRVSCLLRKSRADRS